MPQVPATKPARAVAHDFAFAQIVPKMLIISIAVMAALAVLALTTQIGVVALESRYPPRGRVVRVPGATLNVVELGPRKAAAPPLVLLHGASCNLEAMRKPLGEMLARKHHVILIDRPGHGFSTREREHDSTPAIQARMLADALQSLNAGPAIVVAHSWSGALAARMALDFPERVAGVVMLAPVTHPWRGGVGWYNRAVTTPVVGPLLAYTVTLPLGLLLSAPGARGVFLPQGMPDGFVKDTATTLLLRPREFLANARDLITLKQAVSEQAPRYGEIRVPVTIISGDVDKTVSTNIHSRPFAAAVPCSRLIVLSGVGHMIQNAAPDIVVTEIEAMIVRLKQEAAARAGSEAR
jgi:pimeloyl-ACP methyl ester carboxylesterase